MEIEFKNEIADLIAFSEYLLTLPEFRGEFTYEQLTWLAIILVVCISWGFLVHPISFAVYLLLAVLYLGIFKITLRKRIRKAVSLDDNKTYLATTKISISDSGVSIRNDYFNSNISWAGIKRVGQNANYILIFNPGRNAYIIPKRAFQNENEAKKFFELASQYKQRSSDESQQE